MKLILNGLPACLPACLSVFSHSAGVQVLVSIMRPCLLCQSALRAMMDGKVQGA